MSPPLYTAFKCNRIVFEDEIKRGAIIVDDKGKIHKIIRSLEECENLAHWTTVKEITEGVLMPGIVDSHVHVNSPGRSMWEDFPSATRAAAAGGVTTIADMPLNSLPPTTTLENLRIKVAEASKCIYIDVAFWGGVIPGNQNELLKMIDVGVVGFKCFLCPSGVDEFPHVTEEDLNKTLEILQNTDSLLAFHAECELNESDNFECSQDPTKYITYLKTRPPEMEYKALKLISKLAEKYNKARYHIVHVSASNVAQIVAAIKNRGVNISAETCPHYLTLVAEEVPNKATEYKCAPPIRSSNNKEELWKCLLDNKINMIVSDHSPCMALLKTDDFLTSWGGISSLQFGLSLIWTFGSKYGISLTDISKLMSAAPAKLCHLDNKKGRFDVGLDADIIVFDPDKKYTIHENMINYKNKITPYMGLELQGKVLRTYLRGHLVYDGDTFSSTPLGEPLLNSL